MPDMCYTSVPDTCKVLQFSAFTCVKPVLQEYCNLHEDCPSSQQIWPFPHRACWPDGGKEARSMGEHGGLALAQGQVRKKRGKTKKRTVYTKPITHTTVWLHCLKLMPFVANMSLPALAQKPNINQELEFTSSLVSPTSSNPSGPRANMPSLPRSGNHCCHLPSLFPLQSGTSYPQLHPSTAGVCDATVVTGQGEQPHF